MRGLSAALMAGSALCAASVTPAAAMPLSNLAAVSRGATANVEKVAVLCGPYRCRWRPSMYYAPVVVAPVVVVPRVYAYGGCGWGACGPYGYGYGAGYQSYGWYNGWGYRGLYRGFWY